METKMEYSPFEKQLQNSARFFSIKASLLRPFSHPKECQSSMVLFFDESKTWTCAIKSSSCASITTRKDSMEARKSRTRFASNRPFQPCIQSSKEEGDRS